MSEEFKRCPFCGSEAKIWAMDGSDGGLAIFGSRKMVRIKCPNCFCDIQVTENCFEDVVTFDEMLDYALEQWNTRNTSTCKNMMPPSEKANLCSECGHVTECYSADEDIQPRFCAECGAKVVCE